MLKIESSVTRHCILGGKRTWERTQRPRDEPRSQFGQYRQIMLQTQSERVTSPTPICFAALFIEKVIMEEFPPVHLRLGPLTSA